MIINGITILLLGAGVVFFLGTSVGLLRFPDFYSRAHAAGKGDTLSTMLLLAGFALYNLADPSWPAFLVSAKILIIVLFIAIASPTATHALINAGFVQQSLPPWLRDDEPKEEQEVTEDLSS